MKEIWKPVVGFEGRYEVSNLGKVKSLEKRRRNGTGWITRRERILKTCSSREGHLYVNLSKQDRNSHVMAVHRLVLEAFVGARPLGSEARHFPDRNPKNNNLKNLQWGTKREQYQDRIKHGTDAKTLWAKGKNGNQWTMKTTKLEK